MLNTLVLNLVLYLVLGLVSIYGAAIVHLIRAEINGYAALEWWDKHGSEFNDVSGYSFAIGITIWPIRLAEFVTITAPNLYECYGKK